MCFPSLLTLTSQSILMRLSSAAALHLILSFNFQHPIIRWFFRTESGRAPSASPLKVTALAQDIGWHSGIGRWKHGKIDRYILRFRWIYKYRWKDGLQTKCTYLMLSWITVHWERSENSGHNKKLAPKNLNLLLLYFLACLPALRVAICQRARSTATFTQQQWHSTSAAFWSCCHCHDHGRQNHCVHLFPYHCHWIGNWQPSL